MGNDYQDTQGGAIPDSDSGRVRALEARYIELLEKRVTHLEDVVAQHEKEDNKEPKDADNKNGAQNLTSNDRIEKHLANGDSKDGRRNSVSSSTGKSTKPLRIKFVNIRYNEEGVETSEDVSEQEAAKADQPTKPKDSVDFIWTRRFDSDNKYDFSEVKILSHELRELIRITLGHDPRLHFASDNTNELTIISPFESLIHNWTTLERLLATEYDSQEWLKIREGAKPRTSTAPVAEEVEEMMLKAKQDLGVLLNQVRATPDVNTILAGLGTAATNSTVTFNLLWTVFPPGALVYATPFMKLPQVFIVKESFSAIYDESESGREKDQKKVWHLYCHTYDFNGRTFDRVLVLFKFEEFQGTRMINTLPVHPLRYHFSGDDAESQQERFQKDLVARGRLFYDYCIRDVGAQMFEYEDEAISHGSGFQRLKNKQNEESQEGSLMNMFFGRRRKRNQMPSKQGEIRKITDRVMVDFDSYIQHAPNVGINAPMGDLVFSGRDDECRCAACQGNIALRNNQRRDYDLWDPKIAKKENKQFSEEQYLICPPRVLGYHLTTRTWLELTVDKVQDIPQPVSDAQFRRLQLQLTYKNLIQNLVQSHTNGSGKQPLMEDIVKGKGKGLVILLHGPPGVGKTLTAESVASLAGKPLFAVSPSDIGLDPAEVEHNLESLFELAARWRAVLLFDEADVFLESRSSHTSDLTRNALVSVLLRVLEYYSGILILTTNRINQFDIAVQSRVNLGIKYTDLSMEQKRRIFEDFISGIDEEKIDDRQAITHWLKTDPEADEYFESLNGRQVRNVLFTAGSLALKDGDCLKLEHIKNMAKNTHKFQESLRVVVQASRAKNEAGRFGD